MAIFKGPRLIAAFALLVCFFAPSMAEAQDGGAGSIGVRPNLATQSRDGFTVCTGTAQNRALYGSKVTGSTGIVAFPGIPFGTAVVTTVTKTGFTGREQNWLVPAPGSTRDLTIYMFTGSGGPTCPGVTTIAGSTPPAPPATSSLAITVDPGPTLGKGGFYVCVGTSQNRAAYGNGVTPPSGPLSFANLPAGGMIKATIVRAGYASVERDWYPNPGQSVVLTVPVTTGNGAFTCPGYVQPYAKEIRAAVTQTSQQAEAGLPVSILPAARVFDQYNNAMGGVPVVFGVTQGGGVVAPASVATGSDGIARVNSWTLGPNAGVNRVTATASGISTPVVFSANGVISPATLERVSAVSQQGATGLPAPQPPAVVVRDRNGNPIGGVSVAFTASAAGGSVSPATVVTGSDGIARATRWTLGPIVGTNTVLASAGSLRATFTATVLAPAGISITLPMPDLDVRLTQSSSSIVAGNQQTYTVKVHNRGAATASAVALGNTLPADLVFSSVRADRGFVCSRSGTSLNCASGAVAAGDSATIRVVMSLASTAQSGHAIVFGTKADPDNSIAESNEANNQAAAAATTQAAVAALVDYRLTSANDLAEAFQLAEANGFEFRASSLDKDLLGNPVRCWIGIPSPDGRATPLMGARSGTPPIGGEFRCFYEFFGRTRKLAPGWQLRSTEWTSSIFSSTSYVEPPSPTSGSAFFSRQIRWSFPLSTDGRQWITSMTLRGPVAANWRDAFK